MSSNVKRLLVEKREGFDLEAKALMKDLKDSLHIDCIDDLRLLKQKYHIEHLVILTKADKLKLSQINQQIQKVSKFLNVKIDNIIPISNKSKFNIQKLQAIINAINTKSKN